MIGLINGKQYDFSVHKMPVFYEKKQVEWVIWGYCDKRGATNDDHKWDNLQPQYYEWLYNSSSKHRSIINRKTLFINGKGVKGEFSHLNPQESAELGAFAFKINNSQIVKKWALNITKIGGFCYEVIPDKGGKRVDIHYVNIANIRRNKPTYDSNGNEEPPIYYFTRNWACREPEENPDWTEFHEWDFTNNFDSNKRYLALYAEDEETLYPIPEYTAAVPYIAADYEIGNFTYNNTKNGMSAGFIIEFFNGDLEEDQKAQIVEGVKSKFFGTDNSGEPMVSFNDIDTEGLRVTPIPNNGQDDRFINLNKQIREEIFAGHTVDPVVVGLDGGNGFNNNADEKRVAIEDFQSYYVSGKQMVIEMHLNAIRAFNEIKGEVFIQRLDPIQEIVSEQELALILTEDERRLRAGYEPKTEEQKTQTIKETIKETERQFKEDQDNVILDFFMSNGMWDEAEGFEVIRNKDFFAEDLEDAEQQEFTTALEALVLRLLDANPSMPVETIAKASNASVDEVRSAITSLQEDNLLTENNEVTNEGEQEQDEIFIVYKYEKSSTASGAAILPTTRPFCSTLVNLSKFKSWTLEDIKRMNNGQGLDVFRSRGGWYRVPGTDRSVPRCRHIWKQLLVRRKNG